MTGFPPSVHVANLYEHTSVKGTRYYLGRLGLAKIVLLPGDPAQDGTPTWRLLLQERAEAPDKPRAAPQDAQTAAGNGLAPGTRRTRQRPRPRPGNGAGDRQPFDDEIPLRPRSTPRSIRTSRTPRRLRVRARGYITSLSVPLPHEGFR